MSEERLRCACGRLAYRIAKDMHKPYGGYGYKIDDVPVCSGCYYGRFACVVNGCDKPASQSTPVGYLCAKHRDQRDHYGMTPQEMAATDWMRSEGILCPICQSAPVTSTDHHHDLGHVRGALCTQCNNVLGMAFDNPETMKRAAAFIELDNLAPGETWKNQIEEAERRMNGDQGSNE